MDGFWLLSSQSRPKDIVSLNWQILVALKKRKPQKCKIHYILASFQPPPGSFKKKKKKNGQKNASNL